MAVWRRREPSRNPTWTRDDEKYYQSYVRPRKEPGEPKEKPREEKKSRWTFQQPSRPSHRDQEARLGAKRRKQMKSPNMFNALFGGMPAPKRTRKSRYAATGRREKSMNDIDRDFGGLI